jgi:hypothetical protein
MDKNEFITKLESALLLLHKMDSAILDSHYNLNERSITFRLAMYLCDQFKEHDVDCEYNRMVDHKGNTTEGDYWAKTICLERPYVSGEDDEASTVFPDIIIHKRKKAENLAVVEVKMAWKNSKKNFDLQKLQAYKKNLLYKYAIYLEINSDDWEITFI